MLRHRFSGKDGEKDTKKPEKKEDKKDKNKQRPPIDFTIELAPANAPAARLPLSRFALVPPPLRSHFTKWPYMDQRAYKHAAEAVFQSFEIPLKAFRIDPAQVKTIRLCFDRTPSGAILIDGIGFRTD